MSLSLRMTISRECIAAGVVHRLVGHAGAHRAVADDGDDVVVVAAEVARHRQAQRRRDRGGGVRGAERIVVALGALGEAGQAAALAQGADAVAAAGEDLVRIGLVADVPDQLVVGRVEHVVERDRQLDHAEAGAEMAAGDGNDADRFLAQLVARAAAAAVPESRRRSHGSLMRSSSGVLAGSFKSSVSSSGVADGRAAMVKPGLINAGGRRQTMPAHAEVRPSRGNISRCATACCGEHAGLRARPLDPQQRDEGRLARPLVLVRPLADLLGDRPRRRAGRRRSGRPARGHAHRRAAHAARSSDALPRMAPALARESDQGAGLHPLHAGHLGDLERRLGRQQVDHLAADHAVAAGRHRQFAAPDRCARAGPDGSAGSAMISKARASSASPARMAVASSNLTWHVGWPRRRSSSSMPAGRHGSANSSAPSRSPPQRAARTAC